MSTHGIEGGRNRHGGLVHDGRHAGGPSMIDAAFALGVIMISGAAYVLGVAPVRAAAMDDGEARAEMVKLDTEKRKLAEDYRSRRAARDAAAQALQGSVRLVPETEINSRRAAIAALAEESAIQIQATRPQATLRGKRFDLVPIEIDGVGSATDFARFARELRRRMPDTAIRSFELSVDIKEATPRFTAKLVWYTLPESVARAARGDAANAGRVSDAASNGRADAGESAAGDGGSAAKSSVTP